MILPATSDNIPLVVDTLARGALVALPTETVYGLAADACHNEAVAAIYRVKDRPAANPLIAHVSSIAMARAYVEIDPLSARLMAAFWPGALTVVLPLRPRHTLSALAHAGLPTLAIRCPQGIFAEIVAAFGRPLVAPSANRSGRISPTTAPAVAAELGDRLGLIVDGGPSAIGVESTIIKIEGKNIIMLRPGGVARTAIEAVAQRPLISQAATTILEAPGQMQSHYAPRATVKLNVTRLEGGEMLLAFGPSRADNHQSAGKILNLSESGDVSEAATRLFAYLRALDQSISDQRAGSIIAVEPIPDEGLGEAINDRLARAAAPRSLAATIDKKD